MTIKLTTTAGAPASTPLLILLSLLTVYLVWGSTYYAIRVAIGSIPPMGMLGLRFLVAGVILYAVLRLRGVAAPTRQGWRLSGVVGVLMLFGGTGLVTLAERQASSSVAAMMIAVSPLFAALIGRFWGEKTGGREWLGIGVGLIGIALLNVSELHATPLAAGLLILAPLCWTFGSQWSRHLPLPGGLMNSAAQMTIGGGFMLLLSALLREPWHTPTPASVWALLYLTSVGSLLAYSAYTYLVMHTRPVLATSYAYVNPLVAVLVGVGVGGEHLGTFGYLALVIIVGGVGLMTWPRRATRPEQSGTQTL